MIGRMVSRMLKKRRAGCGALDSPGQDVSTRVAIAVAVAVAR